MEAKFSVSELKKKIDAMVSDGIEYVELSFYDRDDVDGELIGASVEFYGYNSDGEEVDYGCIEEVVDDYE